MESLALESWVIVHVLFAWSGSLLHWSKAYISGQQAQNLQEGLIPEESEWERKEPQLSSFI